MNITKLKLENFRNYDSQEIEFNKGINVIYGDNAQGKTNIFFYAQWENHLGQVKIKSL